MPSAILLLSCPDQKGLVARLSGFVYERGGNILHADHHGDVAAGIFLSRLEWELDGFALAREEIAPHIEALATELGADWRLQFSDERPRIALFVTRQDHCLVDLCYRQSCGELRGEIPLVISNHPRLEARARQWGAAYHWLPITPDTRREQEQKQLELLRQARIDLVVLARYMQVLSAELLAALPPAINIHHSFLPAFAGARPYHQAYRRGVKLIGATAHYVTAELDGGPIIQQDVVHVSHREGVRDMLRKGKDLERVVLARAVRAHLESRVLVYGNKTAVFE